MEINEINNGKECMVFVQPVRDVLDIINGKWKLPIIIALSFGAQRFKELERTITGISPRMLSKELRELEVHELVSRKEYNTVPLTVEYALTDYGKSLDEVIVSLRDWGLNHRKKLFSKA